jgi:hypothetical protein
MDLHQTINLIGRPDKAMYYVGNEGRGKLVYFVDGVDGVVFLGFYSLPGHAYDHLIVDHPIPKSTTKLNGDIPVKNSKRAWRQYYSRQIRYHHS